MPEPLERRQVWSRIIGVERRAAPTQELNGHVLPDPTLLEDEEFREAKAKQDQERRKAAQHFERWEDPTRFD